MIIMLIGVSNPQHQQIHVICLRPPTLWRMQSKKNPHPTLLEQMGTDAHILIYKLRKKILYNIRYIIRFSLLIPKDGAI